MGGFKYVEKDNKGKVWVRGGYLVKGCMGKMVDELDKWGEDSY